MNLNFLVGTEITAQRTVTEGLIGRAVAKDKYQVIAAYPGHVLAIRQGDNDFVERRSFSVGELVQMGVIERG